TESSHVTPSTQDLKPNNTTHNRESRTTIRNPLTTDNAADGDTSKNIWGQCPAADITSEVITVMARPLRIEFPGRSITSRRGAIDRKQLRRTMSIVFFLYLHWRVQFDSSTGAVIPAVLA